MFKAETKEYQRPIGEKEKKWDLVPEKNARKVAADYVVKKALVIWGDLSSESGELECPDDVSMLDDDGLVELFKIQNNEANGPETKGNQESNDVGPGPSGKINEDD
ncbi:hypothetical protein H5410_050254 [Solanum commersonii]|uniref:Uncharacterized protein n=1 Tax=Solanum commersonii TaxID=4109 RepID=A0A9J5WUX0_SOLCO|nr:hypothetical protein H5410_050254 [Solanum commersonii]